MSPPTDPKRLSAFEDDVPAEVNDEPAHAEAHKDGTRCPHCGSAEVRLSHRHAGHASRTTYRCRACKRHFRVETPLLKGKLMTGLAVAGVLAMAVVFGLFQENDPAGSAAARIDDSEAMKALQTAAKRGDHAAEYELGRTLWLRGEYAQSLPWIQTAAGHQHADAEYLLGMAYLQGRGTVQNFRSALEHFGKAAELGQLDAQYQLGIFHRDGLGTPASKETAYLWLNLAAARGHSDALILRDKLVMVMSSEELTRAQEASEQALKRFNGVVAAAPAGQAEPAPRQ